MRRLSYLVCLASAALLLGSPAVADDSKPCTSIAGCGTVTAGPASFVAGAVTGNVVPNRDRGTPGGAASRANVWTGIEEYVTPTCMGNGLLGADALCAAAVTSCGAPGLLRYWVWQREVTYTRVPMGSVAGRWQMLSGSYCLGADDAGVPDYGRAISMVQRGFQDLPLPRPKLQVAPAPNSLVQVPTAFYAGGQQTFRQAVTPVPGVTITVSARPTSWTWRWGDGHSDTFSTPGRPGDPLVSHVYSRARDFGASVVVSWTGSFTVAGSSEVFDIPTPALVTSPPVTVQVRQARTQLVDRG